MANEGAVLVCRAQSFGKELRKLIES